jgi:hypothetical protein
MPVAIRSSSVASTSESGRTSLTDASGWNLVADAFSATVSTSVFQSPQPGHCPCHFGALAPHSVQVKSVLILAMIRIFRNLYYVDECSLN